MVLLEITGVPKQDLFCSHDELVVQALAKPEKQVAYVEEEAAAMTLKENSP
jgi:hypothetical protein